MATMLISLFIPMPAKALQFRRAFLFPLNIPATMHVIFIENHLPSKTFPRMWKFHIHAQRATPRSWHPAILSTTPKFHDIQRSDLKYCYITLIVLLLPP